jgi:hypothetical protein
MNENNKQYIQKQYKYIILILMSFKLFFYKR